MKVFIQVLTVTIFIAHSQVMALDYISKPSRGHLNFEAVGKPAMIKIKGEAPAPKSTLTHEMNSLKVESVIELEQLKTGIDLRDEHMKEKYLETKKYPEAKLVIEKLSIPDSLEVKDQEFTGVLSLHGKDAPVKGLFSITKDAVVNAEFKIKLTDHGILIPEYMGIKVAETVNIQTKIEFEKK